MNLLLDCALKATAILFAAWTATCALRRASADVRHMIWLMATLAVATLPAILAVPQTAIPSAVLIAIPAMAAAPQIAHKFPWMLTIWAVGAALMLIRLIFGITTAARITRSAKVIDGIHYSERASTPLTWGFVHPVVILPSYALNWSDAERDVVLRHERAHIGRHDWLWQILSSVTTAVFWFHPLMWLANLQLRREAESAVDDCVLRNGVAPSDYAGRLLDVARHLSGISSPATVIPMIRKPELAARVQSILDPTRRRTGTGILLRSAIVLAGIALVLPIAATRQKVYAYGQAQKLTADMTRPRILYKEEPQYTEEARGEKIEGAVIVQAEVSTAGQAENIRITKSLERGLDANAITALSHWRFQPALDKNGEPVAVLVTIEVHFRLL